MTTNELIYNTADMIFGYALVTFVLYGLYKLFKNE